MTTAKASSSAGSGLWKVDSGSEEDYWREYEAVRPNYADSDFLRIIYEYHSCKLQDSTLFGIAHDVACGSGKAAIEISKRFGRVIASDSNISSLDALRKCQVLSSNHIQYVQCTAENLSRHCPPESANLITAAQCFPLLDSAAALSSFARVLKPNGTLAIWFYGRPHFSELEYKARCQPLFDRILNLTFGKVIKGGDTENRATWKRAAEGMASWLDNVDLSDGHWDLVQRIKWNAKSAKMGFGPEAVDFVVELTNRVRMTEKVVEKEDAGFWKAGWNIHGVRKYVNSSFPGVDSAVEADAEMRQLFEQLKVGMGGEKATRLYTWPIVLILASRSRS